MSYYANDMRELPDIGDFTPNLGDGIGEMGWSLKKAFKKAGRGIKRGVKKGIKRGIKRGVKKAFKKAFKYQPTALTTRLALKAAKKAKLGKGLKKIGKAAWKKKKFLATPGVSTSIWGIKKIAKTAFGPKRPSKIAMPDGEVIEPDQIEEDTGIPSEAVAEAAMEANKAGDDEEARQEAVDEVEERYGLEDDALQPVADATEEESSDEEEYEEEGDEIEGMGWSVGGAFKKIGRGIKKGAKASGGVLKKGAKFGGKYIKKGAKIAGKGAYQATSQAVKLAAAKYLGVTERQEPAYQTIAQQGKRYAPYLLGGGALLVGFFLLRRRK